MGKLHMATKFYLLINESRCTRFISRMNMNADNYNSHSNHKDHKDNNGNEIYEQGRKKIESRRFVLQKMALLPAALTLSSSKPASAVSDPLFAPNPLTNPVLEKIRIWNQDAADNIAYGGELAPGSPKGRETYAKLSIPILKIESDLQVITDLIHLPNGEGLTKANQILEQPYFTKLAFKKAFNAFADNIYFSDPDRANLYLGGGATPKNEQSIAYLLRNDILTNVEYLQAEVVYMKKIVEGKEKGDFETDDLFEYVNKAQVAMGKYINLIPPEELKMGRRLLLEQSSQK